ncbi:hypothetical protein DSL72_002626 [Monilinia vaccinii-corymbosi]|uniref:Uncharacterized protein n=1 Tax=Monilinia vaccinii-corymbosi TaxID=61207 RepID=A0A8A3PD91_9HELO|nr:hypothetical protein DSL72_002626 [Monilinia vaccinii-corymbosi]
MRRPCLHPRTTSFHARYNPIQKETQVKPTIGAASTANPQSHWTSPTSIFSSDSGSGSAPPPEFSESSANKTQAPAFKRPSPRASGTFFATNHNTYTPTHDSTENIYDAAEREREREREREDGPKARSAGRRRRPFSSVSLSSFWGGKKREGEDGEDVNLFVDDDDDDNYRSNPFNDGSERSERSNPFLDPMNPINPEQEKTKNKNKNKNKNKKSKPTNEKQSKPAPPPKKSRSSRSSRFPRSQAREEEKCQAKERARARKRPNGLGWAKSWSFGGERWGGVILADSRGVRVPILRCKGPCGWSCGF